MINVTYSSNNSGGSWWLSDEDWRALEAAGWTLEPLYGGGERWLGAIATGASKDFESMREAVEEFESITGQDASDEGCNCCGNPHNFSGRDENGNYVEGPSIRVSTSLEW